MAKASEHYTDLAIEQDSEGIFDILINSTPADPACRDFVLTAGEDSALVVSLFSDRRAYQDEVADPMKRRGWIGDLVSDVLGDRHGSGLWLYEQRRLTDEVAEGLRVEAEHALHWFVEEGLMKSVACAVDTDKAKRTLFLRVTGQVADGSVFSEAYQLANATRTGLLARI